jgi:hypothetical protein
MPSSKSLRSPPSSAAAATSSAAISTGASSRAGIGMREANHQRNIQSSSTRLPPLEKRRTGNGYGVKGKALTTIVLLKQVKAKEFVEILFCLHHHHIDMKVWKCFTDYCSILAEMLAGPQMDAEMRFVR